MPFSIVFGSKSILLYFPRLQSIKRCYNTHNTCSITYFTLTTNETTELTSEFISLASLFFTIYEVLQLEVLLMPYVYAMVSHCVIGKAVTVFHASICPHGAFPIIWHNDVQDLTAKLKSEVCHDHTNLSKYSPE